MYRGKQIAEILQRYKYPEPLHLHLQAYFKANKKLGGRDRRELRDLTYMYMRLAPLLQGDLDEQVAALQSIRQDWPEAVLPSVEMTLEELERLTTETIEAKWEKVKDIYPEANPLDLWPFKEREAEAYLNNHTFAKSLLQQPWVWLHATPKGISETQSRLTESKIPFALLEDGVFCLPPQTDLEVLHGMHHRIQDYSTAKAVEGAPARKEQLWWDCCAGAGGKAMALLSRQPQVQLYATDVRPQIIRQLEGRLHPNQRSQVRTLTVDLRNPVQNLPVFDGIIADVPCTGSGTWARTPEHLRHFKPKQITEMTALQRQIGDNVWPRLKPGGHFLYITCAIFADENEGFVEAFGQQHRDAQLKDQHYSPGYRFGAENIFVAHFEKA